MNTEPAKSCSLGKLYLLFTKLGALTFGGGLSMIPLLERELVKSCALLSRDEFADMLTITNSAPGTFAANSSTYIGYKLRGIPGAIVCLLGNITVPFFLIIIISALILNQGQNIWLERFFMGVRPAVIALIFFAGLNVGKRAVKEKAHWVLAFIALILIIYTSLNPIFLIIFGAVSGILLGLYKDKKPKAKKTPNERGN